MKDFIKNNWFKLIILIFVIVVSVSLIYYFIFFLPEQQIIDKQIKCNEEVDKLRERVPEVRRSFELIETYYNKESNNCYAFVLDSYDDMSFYIVYDAFKASSILNYITMFKNDSWEIYGPNDDVNTIDDIETEAKKLMYSN